MNRAGCGAVILEVITLQGRLCFNTGGQREFTCYTDFMASSDAALLEWTWSYVQRLFRGTSPRHIPMSSSGSFSESENEQKKKQQKKIVLELLKCHLGKIHASLL